MIKPEKLWKLLAIVMVAIVSIGFASCSDDDDDDVSLVGTWRCDWSDEDYNYTNIFYFKTDSTGVFNEGYMNKDDKSTYGPNRRFKYAFDSKDMTISILIWDLEKNSWSDHYEHWHISNLASKSMVVDGYTYNKQDESQSYY